MSKSKRKLKRAPTPGQPAAQNEISPESASVEDASTPGGTDAGTESTAGAPAESSAPAPVFDRYNEPSLIAKLAGAKKVEYRPGFVDPEIPHEYKRSAFKHFVRYPMSMTLLLLNIAVVMSFFERIPKHQLMDPVKEVFFFGVVGFIDVFMFIPVLFEVNRILTDKDGLTISALYWKVRLRWDQLVTFEQPKFLKFAILRTKKTFYLLNKYDLKPYFELAEIISAKMPPSIEDREA